MNSLSLNELLEYCNGFSFENGHAKVYKNYDLNTSKELACHELDRRTEKHRKENRIKEISDELNKSISTYTKDKCYYKIYFVDTGMGNEVHNLSNEFSKQSLVKHRPELEKVKKDIFKKIEMLDGIWTSDPNNLRYQSKFPRGRLRQEYYDLSGLSLSTIYTKRFDFIYNNSVQLGREYLPKVINDSRTADIVIYPEFLNPESSVFFSVKEFLSNYIPIKYNNSLMWVLFIDNLDTDDEELQKLAYLESEGLENSIKNNHLLFFKQLKFARIKKMNNVWNLDKLLAEIDESVEKYSDKKENE